MRIPATVAALLWLAAGVAGGQPAAPSEPAPADEEARVRDLLRQAERVKLQVEWVGVDENGYGEPVLKSVATVAPGDFRVALDNLRLLPFHDGGFGTATNPVLYFGFFRGSRELGMLSLGYNGRACEHWISAQDGARRRERRDLNPESVLPLRLWVSEHPELQKILLRLGAERDSLRPDFRQPKAQK